MLSLVAGIFLDWWKGQHHLIEIQGYTLRFLVGFLVGLAGVFYLMRIPETPMSSEINKFLKLLMKSFKDVNFRRLIYFMASWNFAVNLAAPFFTVYMLSRLGVGMSVIVALSIVSQVFNFLFLGLWGKWTDRFSNKAVMAVSGPLFIFCILGWTFTTMPEKHFLTFPLLVLLHVLMGAAIAGVSIASGNIGLKLAPKGEATAYLAANTLINSLAVGIAPVIGGTFAAFFAVCNLFLVLNWSSPGKEVALQALNFQHWDFFFAFAFLFGLYALHRLSLIEKVGEVNEQFVFDEFMGVVKRPLGVFHL